MVTLGESIDKYQDAFTIANLDLVWVLLDVHEKDLAQVRIDQPVDVRTEAYPGETFKARVSYVEPVVDHKTRTARVRLEVDNRAGKLRLHQFVTARILDGAARYGHAAIAVPKSALARIDGAPVVFVRAGRGFERRIVEPGPAGGELVEVRSGLKPGEEVAVLAAAAVDELR
jgi:RND family efflux transporter MFP subunit